MADLRKFVAFEGFLGLDGLRWPIGFSVRVDDAGELEFTFQSLAFTRETAAIRRAETSDGDRVRYFRLEGLAGDGMRFQTEHLHLNASVLSDQTGDNLQFSATCLAATLSDDAEPQASPVATLSLRGYECLGSLTADCPLGRVTMGGSTRLPDGEALSGMIRIAAPGPPDDPVKWRRDVDEFLEYLRRLMSFGAGRDLKAPLLQVWEASGWTLTVRSQTPGGTTSQPTIHFLDQQPFFAAAVAAFFSPPAPVKHLLFAVEWFTMAAGYTEVRLIHAMTALENLTNANLPAQDAHFLAPKAFDRLARAMRADTAESDDDAALAAFRDALPAKMADLNRRPLHDKIGRLLELWSVPTSDLPEDGLELAIKARNAIVHRGHYYPAGPDAGAERDLWRHVILTRELITRIVMTVVGYQGPRIGWIGGYHLTSYPPPERRES